MLGEIGTLLIPCFNGYSAMMWLIINYNQQLLGVSAGFNAIEEREVRWNSERVDWTVFL
jgi:hypothetical protein